MAKTATGDLLRQEDSDRRVSAGGKWRELF
jgi:hypothetical protein